MRMQSVKESAGNASFLVCELCSRSHRHRPFAVISQSATASRHMPLSPGGYASAPDDMDALEQIMEMNRRLQASLMLQEFVRNRQTRQDETLARSRRVMIDSIGPVPSIPPPVPAKIWTVEDLVDAMLDDDHILHTERGVDEIRSPADEITSRVDMPLNNDPELVDAAVESTLATLDDDNIFNVEHDVDEMWSPADEIPSRQDEEPEEEELEDRRTEIDVSLNNEQQELVGATADQHIFDVEHDVDEMWSLGDEINDEISRRQGEEQEEEVPEERRTEAEWAELQRRRARQVEELRREAAAEGAAAEGPAAPAARTSRLIWVEVNVDVSLNHEKQELGETILGNAIAAAAIKEALRIADEDEINEVSRTVALAVKDGPHGRSWKVMEGALGPGAHDTLVPTPSTTPISFADDDRSAHAEHESKHELSLSERPWSFAALRDMLVNEPSEWPRLFAAMRAMPLPTHADDDGIEYAQQSSELTSEWSRMFSDPSVVALLVGSKPSEWAPTLEALRATPDELLEICRLYSALQNKPVPAHTEDCSATADDGGVHSDESSARLSESWPNVYSDPPDELPPDDVFSDLLVTPDAPSSSESYAITNGKSSDWPSLSDYLPSVSDYLPQMASRLERLAGELDERIANLDGQTAGPSNSTDVPVAALGTAAEMKGNQAAAAVEGTTEGHRTSEAQEEAEKWHAMTLIP